MPYIPKAFADRNGLVIKLNMRISDRAQTPNLQKSREVKILWEKQRLWMSYSQRCAGDGSLLKAGCYIVQNFASLY